jgi:antitoxin YefM
MNLAAARTARSGRGWSRWHGTPKVAISASEARSRLFPLIQQINDDHVPVRISSKSGDAVLMSAEDFDSWQATIYLLRSPANARRLMEAVARDKSRQGAWPGRTRAGPGLPPARRPGSISPGVGRGTAGTAVSARSVTSRLYDGAPWQIQVGPL